MLSNTAVIVNHFQSNTRHHNSLEWAEQLHSLLDTQACYDSCILWAPYHPRHHRHFLTFVHQQLTRASGDSGLLECDVALLITSS